jgi:preprotein translocase subunit SecG
MNYILAVLISIVILVFGLMWLNESQAAKIQAQAQAQATIIRAESDARFRDAQSTALMMAAVLPVVFVLVIGIVAVVLIFRVKGQQEARLIERQVIYILPAGQPRRELWQALREAKTELVLQERKSDTRSVVVIR